MMDFQVFEIVEVESEEEVYFALDFVDTELAFVIIYMGLFEVVYMPIVGYTLLIGIFDSADRVADRVVDKVADKVVDRIADMAVDRVVDRVVDKAVDKVVDKIADTIAERAVDMIVDSTVQTGIVVDD